MKSTKYAILEVCVMLAVGCFFAGVPLTSPTLGGYGSLSSHGWVGTICLYVSLSKFLSDPTSKSRALLTSPLRVVALILLTVGLWYSLIGPLRSPKKDPWEHRFLHGMLCVLGIPLPLADFAEERGYIGQGAATAWCSFTLAAIGFLIYNHPIYRLHIQTVGHQMSGVLSGVAALSLAAKTLWPAVKRMAHCAYSFSVGMIGAAMWSLDFTKRNLVEGDDDVNNVMQMTFMTFLALLLFTAFYLRIFGVGSSTPWAVTENGEEELEPVMYGKAGKESNSEHV